MDYDGSKLAPSGITVFIALILICCYPAKVWKQAVRICLVYYACTKNTVRKWDVMTGNGIDLANLSVTNIKSP